MEDSLIMLNIYYLFSHHLWCKNNIPLSENNYVTFDPITKNASHYWEITFVYALNLPITQVITAGSIKQIISLIPNFNVQTEYQTSNLLNNILGNIMQKCILFTYFVHGVIIFFLVRSALLKYIKSHWNENWISQKFAHLTITPYLMKFYAT